MSEIAQKVQRLEGEVPTINPPRAPGTGRKVDIYIARCIKTGKVYVGSAFEGNDRVKEHIDDLMKGSHGNRYFQNAWNKYGAGGFDWDFVEVCNEHNRREREQWWIEQLKSNEPEFGYNQTYPVRSITPSQRASKLRRDEWTEARKAEWSSIAQAQMKARWEDPVEKEKFLTGLAKAVAITAQNKEKHKRASERMKAWKDDPILDAKRNENLKKGRTVDVWANDQERRDKAAKRGKKTMERLWADPDYPAQRAADTAAQWKNPEVKAKMIAGMMKPEARAKILAASARTNAKRRADALARKAGKDIV
jgi:group I intron endonuclease